MVQIYENFNNNNVFQGFLYKKVVLRQKYFGKTSYLPPNSFLIFST